MKECQVILQIKEVKVPPQLTEPQLKFKIMEVKDRKELVSKFKKVDKKLFSLKRKKSELSVQIFNMVGKLNKSEMEYFDSKYKYNRTRIECPSCYKFKLGWFRLKEYVSQCEEHIKECMGVNEINIEIIEDYFWLRSRFGYGSSTRREYSENPHLYYYVNDGNIDPNIQGELRREFLLNWREHQLNKSEMNHELVK